MARRSPRRTRVKGGILIRICMWADRVIIMLHSFFDIDYFPMLFIIAAAAAEVAYIIIGPKPEEG